MRLASTTRSRPRSSSRTAAKRSALDACRFRLFICRVTSSKMSSTRARFCLALSRRSSASRFLFLKRVIARRLLDDGAAVVRLGAEQLADPLLPDDGVALRPQARAHEDVLNVAQAAELAVQQVLALAGAEEPPGNHDLALLRRALELAAANLEHHRLRTLGLVPLAGPGCGWHLTGFDLPVLIEHLAGLLVGDDLLGLDGPLAARLVFVPVGRAVVLDHHLRLHGHRPLVGLGIDQGQRHFGHAQRLAVAGSGKDHVLHVRAAQGSWRSARPAPSSPRPGCSTCRTHSAPPPRQCPCPARSIPCGRRSS